MRKQFLHWKPIRSVNRFGIEYRNPYFPNLISKAYRGLLLEKIISMEQKKPISYEIAVNLAQDEFVRAGQSGQIGQSPGQSRWYYINFVEFISNQGFHIELTGDEF